MDRATFEHRLPAALPRLRALAARLVGDDQAQDVVQESLLRATRALSSFRGEAAIETWLFAITSRAAIDHLRSRRRFRVEVMVEACDERGAVEVARELSDPSVAFDVREHVAFCFGCVGRSLEPELALALVLREVFGLSNDECAAISGVTEPVHRHRLERARAQMSETYDQLCALVRKDGPCHQCSTLRSLAPAGQRGPELPAPPLAFDERVGLAREAGGAGTSYARLRDYFLRASRALNGG